jgi:5-methylcytosine-specific restriction endonuclease McrA
MSFYNSYLWYRLRDETLRRDNYCCQKCRMIFDTKKMARMFLIVHHVIPRSKGGKDTLDNLQTLCFRCHEDMPGGGDGHYEHRMRL